MDLNLIKWCDTSDMGLLHRMAAEDVPLLSAAEMARVIETAHMTQMEARRLAAVVHGQQTKQPSDETAGAIVRPKAEE